MSLLIAEHISIVLSADENLTALVDDKIYPIAVATDVEFPFIVFMRDELNTPSTCDGLIEDEVGVSVVVFAREYMESAKIAHLVRQALHGSIGEYDDFKVTECRFAGASETFSDDVYVQELTFNLTTE